MVMTQHNLCSPQPLEAATCHPRCGVGRCGLCGCTTSPGSSTRRRMCGAARASIPATSRATTGVPALRHRAWCQEASMSSSTILHQCLLLRQRPLLDDYHRVCRWVAVLAFGEGWHNNHHGEASANAAQMAASAFVMCMSCSLRASSWLAANVLLICVQLLSTRRVMAS
jgi:hypothetical protein